LSSAILLTAFAFFGFDAPTVMAGEVRNASRSVPFAILLSVGSVVVLYTLIQIVCVGTLPDLAASERHHQWRRCGGSLPRRENESTHHQASGPDLGP